MSPPNEAQLTQRVGTVLAERYQLTRLLGAGGMGAVYEAVDARTERRVAVKVMLGGALASADRVERFVREARAATRIAHPNIVEVLDTGRDGRDGALFIVQEFLKGRDLRRRLARVPLPSPDEALAVVTPVAGALAAAHACGIVHQDIKPENIFLVEHPTLGVVPKLIDFGVAKVSASPDAKLAHAGATYGTPAYASPEQARGEATIDAQTDVWALGVVLYEMLAGRSPFDRETRDAILAAILSEPAPPLTRFAPRAPPVLVDLVHRALERDRRRRFATMAQMYEALQAACASREPSWAWSAAGQYASSSQDTEVVALPDAGADTTTTELVAPPPGDERVAAPAWNALASAPAQRTVGAIASREVVATAGEPAVRRRRSGWTFALALAAIVLGLGAAGAWMWRRARGRPASVVSAPVQVRAAPPPPVATVRPAETAVIVQPAAPPESEESVRAAPSVDAGAPTPRASARRVRSPGGHRVTPRRVRRRAGTTP